MQAIPGQSVKHALCNIVLKLFILFTIAASIFFVRISTTSAESQYDEIIKHMDKEKIEEIYKDKEKVREMEKLVEERVAQKLQNKYKAFYEKIEPLRIYALALLLIIIAFKLINRLIKMST